MSSERFPQFTLERLHTNYAHAKASPHSPRPLTLRECERALRSSDAIGGWLRYSEDDGMCLCGCCMNFVGTAHAPECSFSGTVADLDDVQCRCNVS